MSNTGYLTMTEPKPGRSLFTDFKVFSGTANPALAEEVCGFLGAPVGAAMIKRFCRRRNPPPDPGKRPWR